MQSAPTTADLRGIDNVGDGVVWASGSGGTVLHSVDGGKTWLRCATPPDAETLDFRGVQAFDAKTAIVMSSGTGDLSRLYTTSDGCASWTLVFTNPDKDGFFDAFSLERSVGIMLGDPVRGHFRTWLLADQGKAFANPTGHTQARAKPGEGAFAASNSSLFVEDGFFTFWFGTGGPHGARIIRRTNHDFDDFGYDTYREVKVPVGSKTASSGVFSLEFRPSNLKPRSHENSYMIGVAVGGDYKEPNGSERVAVCTGDGGDHWSTAATQPHGYRSAVAYDPATKSWITVGPNGTDVSTDDGRNWRALRPAAGDAPDADKNWNALSLPFVVGPKGRIGVLNSDALKVATK